MTTSTTRFRSWYRPMRARRPDEPHRTATPLELFFDLCFVVAVAQASGSLHHDLAENHLGHAVLSYLTVFFAIWWAWMNFTWFASAYDTDDDVYRATGLVQIAGALILAAGVPRAFTEADFTTITYGYVVMRLGTIVNWLRAAAGNPDRRATAIAYAVGVFVVQLGWLLRLALPDGWRLPAFLVLALADVLVPLVAERRGKTSWHPHHIAERYQLFTLIVLGEAILSISVAIQTGVDAGNPGLWGLAAAGAVIVFALWWLYFDRPGRLPPSSLRGSLFWGYGHYLIFAAVAAVGAGLAVAVDHDLHTAHVSSQTAGYAVAVPVAVYLITLWALHLRWKRGLGLVLFPIAAVLVLAAPWLPAPVPALAGLLFVLVAVTLLMRHRQSTGVPA
ncbi:low temperature requirement protein A [Micromonospora sp. 4G57]|uniref:Low temperature requirement protein A n=1 Tax=Micromonospora sicca TaxID=2202420 RepID=A0ABU5J5Q2_9ACTN|nr:MULTISPECIES: low temperature requirement protein A [unclassified Micromonospora]MDZ5444972.1 low temperature requirement protein A [Micromonospora sp. 4G57]MDZ5487868.1 low temperature requirement protein A [Micromonospora sp. 4G53]